MPVSTEPLAQVGLQVPSLLLPRADVSLPHWAVVACDQYTSQPEYWQRVEEQTRGHRSTLNLILPEVYLEQPDTPARVRQINQTMASYLREGVVAAEPPGFMLVERHTHRGDVRLGLVVALDLEHYDYRPGATSLIRATEGTILERLPPRMEIRRHAPLELPHIMVLIDDPAKTVIEPIAKNLPEPRYDFELMEGGGHLKGTLLTDRTVLDGIGHRLAALATLDQMQAKYGTRDRGVFLYAIGDGNHSLATAKSVWDSTKEQLAAESQAASPAGQGDTSLQTHPARYALVELVNVHDAGLAFKPIHRVLFNVDVPTFVAAMDAHFRGEDPGYTRAAGDEESIQRCLTASGGETILAMITALGLEILRFEKPKHTLAVGTLQLFLDRYVAEHKEISIDYIHGENVVNDLGRKPNNVGFYLPPIRKQDLFRTVVLDGLLPRKAFSMGEAEEKRFYMEGRRITR